MIIGVDIRTFLDNKLTGVGVYLKESLTALLALDQSNQYKLFINSFSQKENQLVKSFDKYPNVKVYSFPYPNKLFNFSLVFFKRPYLDRLIGGCDLFWFPNLIFWQVSRACQTVATAHDFSFERLPWAYSFKSRLWHKMIAPRKKLSGVTKILAVSQNTKKDLQQIYGLNEEKIEVVYPGVTTSLDYSQDRNYHLPKNYLLFVGTLEPRKNVDGLIKAFEKIDSQDIFLVIAGGKGWQLRQASYIIDTVRRSAKSKQIILLDYVDDQHKQALYRHAKALVWPSFYEGFGFPVLEAMVNGCPVITSFSSSLPEVAGKAAILIDPFNTNEITQAINLVLADEPYRQKLISQGHEQVKKFNWQSSAQNILRIFKSLS